LLASTERQGRLAGQSDRWTNGLTDIQKDRHGNKSTYIQTDKLVIDWQLTHTFATLISIL
jgi:hypothetical protein